MQVRLREQSACGLLQDRILACAFAWFSAPVAYYGGWTAAEARCLPGLPESTRSFWTGNSASCQCVDTLRSAHVTSAACFSSAFVSLHCTQLDIASYKHPPGIGQPVLFLYPEAKKRQSGKLTWT